MIADLHTAACRDLVFLKYLESQPMLVSVYTKRSPPASSSESIEELRRGDYKVPIYFSVGSLRYFGMLLLYAERFAWFSASGAVCASCEVKTWT